jgi:flavin reductase (DIM6/NTAB) family NADH-FMN oxidoreductase RutF
LIGHGEGAILGGRCDTKEDSVDQEAKKTALRMIPYGLYVLTTGGETGPAAASTVNWVTQASFDPPLVAVGVRAESSGHQIIKDTQSFVLNVLGKGQQDLAFKFFKPASMEAGTIAGESFRTGATGAPILESTPAYVECHLVGSIEKGDHSVFVAEVVGAGVSTPPEGRADDATLWLKDLGEKTFYGG